MRSLPSSTLEISNTHFAQPGKKHLKANNRQGVSVIEMTKTLGLQPEISSSD